MQPASRDLEVYAGDKYDHEITFQDADSAPLALSGTWRAQIRAKKTDADPLVSFTIDTTNAATGVLLLSLTKEQTVALPSICVWDLENVTEEMTYLAGKIRVLAQVSR